MVPNCPTVPATRRGGAAAGQKEIGTLDVSIVPGRPSDRSSGDTSAVAELNSPRNGAGIVAISLDQLVHSFSQFTIYFPLKNPK